MRSSFLDTYINDHLAYEELYMEEHKYPERENHIKYHRDFIEHYKSFRARLDAGVPKKTLALEIETIYRKLVANTHSCGGS